MFASRGQCRLRVRFGAPPVQDEDLKTQRMSRRLCVLLKLAQVVVEGLDIGENTHGVWFTTHDHHVVHLNQPVTACLGPGGEAGHKNTLLQM